jgi:hypothetical protein
MAKYTATLTVAISAEIAEEIYQAALEDDVGPSVMGRKLIEDGLAVRHLRRDLRGVAEKISQMYVISAPEVAEMICDLAKDGYSSEEIAERVNATLNEERMI